MWLVCLIVGHRLRGLCGPPVEVECIGEIEAEDGDAVEHSEAEQRHAGARREHVRVLASEEPNNSQGDGDECHEDILQVPRAVRLYTFRYEFVSRVHRRFLGNAALLIISTLRMNKAMYDGAVVESASA